jgi:hypothetical protein
LESAGVSDPEREKPRALGILRQAADAADAFLSAGDEAPGAPAGLDEAADLFAVGPLPQVGVGGAVAIDELVRLGSRRRQARPVRGSFISLRAVLRRLRWRLNG